MIVLGDDANKATTPHLLPREGVNGYVVRRVARCRRDLRYHRIALKDDQEPATMVCKEEAMKELDLATAMEHPSLFSAGGSQSSGRAERAVAAVKRGRPGP